MKPTDAVLVIDELARHTAAEHRCPTRWMELSNFMLKHLPSQANVPGVSSAAIAAAARAGHEEWAIPSARGDAQ